MEYIAETSLANFPFWSGAKDRAAMLTWEQLNRIESELESIWFDKTPTDSEINDLFWFEFEYVCGLIGLIYASDGNIYECKEDWAEAMITKQYPDVVEELFSEFWYDCEGDADDWSSTTDVIDAWDEWHSNYWLDFAHKSLDEAYPDHPEDARDDFACEHWQNCGSKEWNLAEFAKWYEREKEKYEG